jgi:glutamate/tyrosine decarboxylase-like PLP-dependent enzyme
MAVPGAPADPPAPLRDLDWDPDRARRFAEQAAALYAELLERLPDLPVSRPWSREDVEAGVARKVPEEPTDDHDLLAYLREVLFDWSMYPGHPGFMAFVSGTGTVPGAVADMLAAGVNMNVGGWRLAPSATEIELQLVRWFADVFGLPPTAGGLMVSGGAMASFVALKAARDAKAGWDVRAKGVAAGARLAFYASDEVHVVTDRAVDMLGLGTEAVRKIPVDRDYRLLTDALREAIAADRQAGVIPVAVVATAGTVATGAIDPLEDIVEICRSEGMWMHVDGAYGAPAVLADDLRPLFAGIERADSIAFDPHKWLYIPHSAGCILFRDMTQQLLSFGVLPTYVQEDQEMAGHGVDFVALGPQFSRGFQALKVWVSLLAHGRRTYAGRISHDAQLARYMAARVESHPELELAAPVTLSICCFRFVPSDLPPGPDVDEYVSRLNSRLMTAVQRDGRAFCSNALLEGRWALRSCIVNYRTESEDVDELLAAAVELGRRMDREIRPPSLRPPVGGQTAG